MFLLERNVVKCQEKHMLWKPYTNQSNTSKSKRTTNKILSCYTPASKEHDISESLTLPVDALKHVNERQINWQDTELPQTNEESPSDLQSLESKQQCIRCQRSYTSNAALVKHQRYYCNFYHTKSFTCKYCDKVYMSLGALKMHIRTHTLPCTCMICGKSFSRPWLLQGHVRTHTGEKPYKCSHCNRAFADRSNLRAHLQTHSQIKKYKCEQCTKTFSRMSLLIKHQTSGSCIV